MDVEQLFYRVPGGTGRYTAQLAAAMAAQFSSSSIMPFSAWHKRSRMDAAFAAFELQAAGLEPTVRLPFLRPLLFDAWHELGTLGPELLSRSLRGADIFHVPFPAAPPVSKPLVMTVHDAGFALFPEAYPKRGIRFHTRALELAARRAGAVLTGTHAALDEIVNSSPVPASILRVVPLGVDQRRPEPPEIAEVLARHRLSGQPYVLWVGSLEPRKNTGALVNAFVRLVTMEEVPHSLVLVGPFGWLHEGIIGDRDRGVLGERLRLLGRVSARDLRSLYAGASVFAFPSLHEGFGMPVLEAMVQGAPVVCSDIPALAEVSGGAARLVAPRDVDLLANVIAEIVNDDAASSKLVEAGYERAGQFTWEKTAAGTHAVYEEVIGGIS